MYSKLSILVILFVALTPTAHAQRTMIFDEQFSGNRNEWRVGETSDANCEMEIENGVYRIEEADDAGFRFFAQLVKYDEKMNYSIKMRVRQTDGSDDNGYGIYFGGAGNDNHYQFIISGNGWARVGRYKEGKFSTEKAWFKTSAPKETEEWNELEVLKVNDAMTFWCNGVFIAEYSASFRKSFGAEIGVIYLKQVSIEVDYLTIEQWQPDPIMVVEGANPNAVKVNLGSNINGTGTEFVDCLSPDGSVLVYSRTSYDANVGSSEHSDIWIAYKDDDGSWKKSENLGRPLNTSSHNFAISITQDLNTLFVQGVYQDDSSNTSGVSYSKRTKDGWSFPVSMPIEDYYNHSSFLNSHISPDGQVMMYSLQRSDTRGANDLYVCKRKADDSWSAPVNVGPVLNTIGNETGPFIAADGVTMYFSSDGHPGYEGFDVFVTRRLDDSWLNWSSPLNLGAGVNTDEHDRFFQVPAKGDSGYYSSNKNSLGETDIFSVALPSKAKPMALFLVKGRVLDANTRQPIEADVVYEFLETNAHAGRAHSSPADGAYRVALVKGKQYGVHAEADGYYPLSEQFDARELADYTEVEKNLLLTPIKKNVAIRLNNVFFDFGKFELRHESFSELDRLVVLLEKNSSYKIELLGHTDNVGNDAANMTLSQNRINSVKDYLISKGIQSSRMVAKGYGKTKPMATNDTDEGRQQNRRVEFLIQ